MKKLYIFGIFLLLLTPFAVAEDAFVSQDEADYITKGYGGFIDRPLQFSHTLYPRKVSVMIEGPITRDDLSMIKLFLYEWISPKS